MYTCELMGNRLKVDFQILYFIEWMFIN